MKLNDRARAGLLDLYLKAKAAERDYLLALNSAVATLGLDPAKPNKVDLDTGDVTPAEE